MPISFAEALELDCPSCGKQFQTNAWLIVDSAERPDLLARILDGTLHDAACPSCKQGGQIPAPLLFHDGRAQRVLFAVPPGMAEEEWQEVAQALLWSLVGSLPDARRLPYLSELQAEAGLEGVARVIRAEGLAAHPEGEEDDADLPPIVAAIQSLLAAHGAGEMQHALQRHPILLDPQAVAILRELAHEAFKQGEDEAGEGFSRAAEILSEFRQMAPALRVPTANGQPGTASPSENDPLDELAFALLRSQSGEMLSRLVADHPDLLDVETDAALAGWSARQRGEGKIRIADGVDAQREALQSMRSQFDQDRPTLAAIQALLEAEDADALQEVLVEHDALYTPTADLFLQRLQASADPELAELIAERYALLRRVKQALNDDIQRGAATQEET